MKILVTGLSHRTAPLDVRERHTVQDLGSALRKIADGEDVEEAAIVSTCNRVELVATSRRPESARFALRRFLEQQADAPGSLDEYVYELGGREAVGHVLRVTSSIDSMVVGEPQILGQMKDAYRAAVEQGTCGPVLSRLFQHAFSTAKRVRSETRIAERPVSVARVGVELARQIFEELRDKRALLVGAGEMIEAALHALRDDGLAQVQVANRTRARAEALAERFGASPHGLDELADLLPGADVVLTCIGGEGHVLDADAMAAAQAARRDRAVFVIDLGVPRNVDPAVDGLDSVFLYDLDDLQQLAAANAERRERETVLAEDIVREEQERFDGWMVALQAVPTIRDLREQAEALREGELERLLSRLELSDEDRERVDAFSRTLVNKLLHAPVSRLRDETDRESGLAMLEAARRLFGLDGGEGGDEGGHGGGSGRRRR